MQLSYNVIKNNSIKNNGLKEIKTEAQNIVVNSTNNIIYKSTMDSYENLAKTILENARIQKEQILAKAYEEASKIEDEALKSAEILKNQAYEEGFMQGQEAGFNIGMQKAEEEKNKIVSSAHELLLNSKEQYELYFESKKSEIFETIIAIAETVIKKELSDKAAINNLIYEALEVSKTARNFIIRCNEIYVEELNSQITNWKEQLGFIGDIFVVKDNSLEIGNAVIDKGNGKLIVGMDYALQKVKELMEGKE